MIREIPASHGDASSCLRQLPQEEREDLRREMDELRMRDGDAAPGNWVAK